MRKYASPETRFRRRVNKNGPVHPILGSRCWVWTGCRSGSEGYGQFRVDGRSTKTHRYSWNLHCGPIPRGRLVLHKCDNPPCVNPGHLFLGDTQANVTDKWNKGRGRVSQGEPHYRSVLTVDSVNDIRQNYVKGSPIRGLGHFAKKYGVGKLAVHKVVHRATWKHVV